MQSPTVQDMHTNSHPLCRTCTPIHTHCAGHAHQFTPTVQDMHTNSHPLCRTCTPTHTHCAGHALQLTPTVQDMHTNSHPLGLRFAPIAMQSYLHQLTSALVLSNTCTLFRCTYPP